MSLQNIRLVIDALLTNEDLRARFAVSRIDTILDLIPQGIVLTADEIELFVKSDLTLWMWKRAATGDRVQ